MDPTTLSIPETLQFLSSLSYDISSFSHRAGIPRAERRFKGDSVVRRLLDALVFFLHTHPNRGDRFAMTLTIVQDEIVATVAANTPGDVPHTDPSSPQVILNTIWKHMAVYSGTADKPTENTQLITYILETHLPLLRSRLSKWRRCYEAYRHEFVWVRRENLLSVALTNYLDDIDTIFCATVAFSESNETPSPESISQFASHIRLCKNLSKQLAKLSDNDRKLLSTTQSACGRGIGTTRYINIIRFGEKLAAPLIHIDRVLYFCRTAKYQDSLTKPFRIRIVPQPPRIDMPTLPNNWTKAEAVAFIRQSYMTIDWPCADPEAVTSAIDHLSGVAMENIGKSRISGPHCECLLVQHHHNEAQGNPIMATYIGLSKPCCLQCGIFLDVYNEIVPNGPLFFIRGRDSHVYPCIVPSIDTAIDASIADKTRTTLTKLICYTVHAYMKHVYDRSGVGLISGTMRQEFLLSYSY
ncbi:hypothetical protein QCA50_014689 [Cerrena zonata]|uniref:Uncharacterized protein n=1 Tax=Cerrena zonata TaxID=2478898 RepID=A0AAW0FK85_9APHY